MFLDQKPFIYVWRPLYRLIFSGLVWPFLMRVRTMFVAELLQRVSEQSDRIAVLERNTAELLRTASEQSGRELVLERHTERITILEQHLRQELEAAARRQAAEWAALERLLLAVLSDPPACNHAVTDSAPNDGRLQ